MMNEAFTTALPLLLCGVLGGLLVVATVTDFQKRIIPNRLNLAIALVAPLYWLSVHLPLWPGVPIQLTQALVIFALFYLFFHFGAMGGGDVKLAAALALWVDVPEMIQLILVMSVAGAPITLAAWADHRRSGAPGRVKVPYGIAIAIGGWVVLAQRYLNHFG